MLTIVADCRLLLYSWYKTHIVVVVVVVVVVADVGVV